MIPVASAVVTLDDKYTLAAGRAYMSGVQALVRLPLLQKQRDAAAGLDTAGFISGYRGSPLGTYDVALAAARTHLAAHDIVFQPGVNEDLAATALWGTQQLGLYDDATRDGVFGIWYGKGPGVDRSIDVLKHANLAGTAPHGGVLALAGDDHACQSSTTAHQSEQVLAAAMIPVLNPASVQDYLDFGLIGFALSRYSGCWVALKAIAETVESSASVDLDPQRVRITLPSDFVPPPDGLNLRWPDTPLDQERRLHGPRMEAVRAFARVNALDRVVLDAPGARLGIAATGKGYLDVRQALAELGIDAVRARELGIRLYKIGMSWPLETDARARVRGRLGRDPRRRGKAAGRRGPARAASVRRAAAPAHRGQARRARRAAVAHRRRALPGGGGRRHRRSPRPAARRASRAGGAARAPRAAAGGDAATDVVSAAHAVLLLRLPAQHVHPSAAGQPSRWPASAAIGWRCTCRARRARSAHMGGEGAAWMGLAPFVRQKHVFQNIGDGTYFHSGLLAIRAAAASGIDITYKILFNDAVAMTGGQAVDGELTVPQITRQVAAEGARRIVVVTDEPGKFAAGHRVRAGHHGAPPRRARRRAARAARSARPHDPGVRPDLRGREAAAAQARQVPGSARAGVHQRRGVRRLRRLLRPVQLRVGAAAGDARRPQAHHRPVGVQQGLSAASRASARAS